MKTMVLAIPMMVVLVASAAPLTENGLQAYWNSATERGLTTTHAVDQADLDKDGKYESYPVTYVETWTSTGTCAVAFVATNNLDRPYYFTNAFTRADGSKVAAVRMNWRPYTEAWTASWRFQHLHTAPGVKVDFNLNQEMTWFFVANIKQNFQGQGGSLWGFTTGEPDTLAPARTGVFSPGTDGSTLRTYALNGLGGAAGNFPMPAFGTPFLMDTRMASRTMTAAVNGVDVIQPAVNQTINTVNPARFEIGAHQDMLEPKFRPSMDIGALVIYNRALNDAERQIARESLAAEFGLSLGAGAVYEGGSGANGNWVYGLTGVGSSTATGTGRVPGVATLSGWSADMLRLKVVTGLDGNGDYLFAARQSEAAVAWTFDADLGGNRLADGWRLERHGTTPGVVRIAFRAPSASGDLRVALVAKASGASGYSPVGKAVAYDTETGISTFDVQSGDLATGTLLSVLRLAGGTAARSNPVVRYRADEDVSVDGTGAVMRWGNGGSLGADLDVVSYSGKVSKVAAGIVRADGSEHAVVRCPGFAYLRSAVKSNLGIGGADTWFVSFKPTSVGGSLGHPVFGIEPWNGRFGAFLPASSTVVRCYAGAGIEYVDIGTVTANAWNVADVRDASNAGLDGSINDATPTSAAGSGSPVPQSQYFAIGNSFGIASWVQYNPPFVGDIAEVRVYDRRLDDVERLRVRQEMMAYCGVVPANSRFVSGDAAAQAYEKDLAAVGSLSEGAPAIVREDCSGGLGLTVTSAPAQGNTLVFAHNGLSGWTGTGSDVASALVTNRLARVWRIVATGNDGLAARLSFPVADLTGRDVKRNRWRLLYKMPAQERFSVLAAEPVTSAGVVSFSLAANGLSSGLYTVAIESTARGLFVVVR